MVDLAQRLAVAERDLATLHEALRLAAPSRLERDGAIQRFEYTFEACWKAAQHYLIENEGVRCASPKRSFRGLGAVGILDAAEVVDALRMTDDRNRTVHVYLEAVATAIFDALPVYATLMNKLLGAMRASR